MEMHWCAIPGGNFGDDLNLLLWPKLFPDMHQHHCGARLYGIGTLLGDRRDDQVHKIVLGSGQGDSASLRKREGWDFRWVRGPLTSRGVGLATDKALGDSAWLWDGLTGPLAPDHRIGLIPHWATWDGFDWPLVAMLAGMRAINPRGGPHQVASEMRGCRAILTESLHGAIFADAMGIPWAVCRLSYRFNSFKWNDWMQSIQRPFAPYDAALPLAASLACGKAVTNRLARWADFRSDCRYNALRPLRRSTLADAERVAEGLERFGRDNSQFTCSRSSFVVRQKQLMLEECESFARKYGLAFVPFSGAPKSSMTY